MHTHSFVLTPKYKVCVYVSARYVATVVVVSALILKPAALLVTDIATFLRAVCQVEL